jgi:hypothetical protein
MQRRGLLLSVGGLLVGTGCTTETTGSSSPSSSPVPSDSESSPTDGRNEANDALGLFYLYNGTETTHSFRVVVQRLDEEETLLDETCSLAGGAKKRFREVITTMGSYRLRFEADTGAATSYTWQIPSCDSYDYLDIRFFDGNLEVTELKQTIDPAPPTCGR